MDRPLTPIDAWPLIKHTGKRGYSARHFALLAGTRENPLHVSERFAVRWACDEISEAAQVKAEREGYSAALDWQSKEQTRVSGEIWSRLCSSFELVVDTLEKAYEAEPSATLKALIREAKRAELAARNG